MLEKKEREQNKVKYQDAFTLIACFCMALVPELLAVISMDAQPLRRRRRQQRQRRRRVT